MSKTSLDALIAKLQAIRNVVGGETEVYDVSTDDGYFLHADMFRLGTEEDDAVGEVWFDNTAAVAE